LFKLVFISHSYHERHRDELFFETQCRYILNISATVRRQNICRTLIMHVLMVMYMAGFSPIEQHSCTCTHSHQ